MAIRPSMLVDLLSLFTISTSSWGQNGAKSVGSLAEEMDRKESRLVIVGNRIHREVSVVKMHICEEGNLERGYFVETEISRDGGKTWQHRKQGTAGKIAGEELPAEALVREIGEELTLVSDYRLTPISVADEARDSNSYPGLPCVYRVHRFEVMLEPRAFLLVLSFKQDRCEIKGSDGVIHIFQWMPYPPL